MKWKSQFSYFCFSFILIFIISPSFADVDSFNGKDVTPEYEELLQLRADLLESASLLKKADVEVLFIPGLFSTYLLSLQKLPIRHITHFGQYFEPQMEWLTSQGIPASRLSLAPAGSIEANAARIEQALRSTTKPLILITHSKGGLETLEALLRHPELLAAVKGWIAIQSPFLGTPVADFIGESSYLGRPASFLLERLGGSAEAISCLTTACRKSFLEAHEKEIQDLLSHLPILFVATAKENRAYLPDTPLELVRNRMLKSGLPNDGLVPAARAVLPGGEYILLHDVDHLETIMDIEWSWFDQIEMLKALLVMMERRGR